MASDIIQQIRRDMSQEEKIFRVEIGQCPIGETGDYDSWIEFITPNFNLQCHDPNVEMEEVEELAEMPNKSSEMEQAIKDVLEVISGSGVPNLEWVKYRLSEAIE